MKMPIYDLRFTIYDLRVKGFDFLLVFLTFAFLLLTFTHSVFAQQTIEKYQTAVGFPEIENGFLDSGKIAPGDTLGTFLTYLFDMSLLIAAITAFGTLVFGGVLYMTSGLADSKSKAREIIEGAFTGILLLVGTYVILFLINPALTRPKLPKFPQPVPPSEKAAAEEKATGDTCQQTLVGQEACISGTCAENPIGTFKCAPSPRGGRCSTRRPNDCATGFICSPDTNTCQDPPPAPA